MATSPQVPWTMQLPPGEGPGNNRNWRELKRIYEQLARVVNSFTSTVVSGVSSVFGRTGAVVAAPGDYSVGQVTGAAPLASPALTGTPTAPTAAPGTNTVQVATTAFVTAAVAAAALNFADGEIPSGLVNGTNKNYTLIHTPNPLLSLILMADQKLLGQGTDYTIVGTAITTVAAPTTQIVAWYRW